jgi:type I restriction enzyme S subunit
MGNIRDGRIDYTDLKYLPADHSDLANTLLKPGDILFNRTNSPELVGKCAVFSGHAGRFSFASYLVRLSPLPHVNPTWLAAAINSPLGREYIASVRVQQVGQANVSAKKIGAMQIRVPPRELQDTLAAELERQIEGLDLVSRAVDTNLARGARLRQSILAFAFTGRLVRAEVAAQTGEMPHAGIVPLPTGLAS